MERRVTKQVYGTFLNTYLPFRQFPYYYRIGFNRNICERKCSTSINAVADGKVRSSGEFGLPFVFQHIPSHANVTLVIVANHVGL